jgi:REP element-mobilizing transposase RayT
MGRPRRLLVPGGIYHVTSRGNRRQPIFLDETERNFFLGAFGCIVARHGWKCHAYCLMTNHFHLLVETPQPDLSAGMQRLNSRYVHWFNARHGVEGHLLERRFHAVLVEGNAHLLELARYVVLNPVRASLCRAAEDWRWSSYRSAIGLDRPPPFLTLDWLLGQFGSDRARARERLRSFVADAPPSAA